MKIALFTKNSPDEVDKHIFEKKQILIAFIGLAASFWTYVLHIQLVAQKGAPLICDVNDTINCSKIIGSSAGEIFGVPLGIWGMVYWLIVFTTIFLPKVTKVSAHYIAFWRMFVGGVGAISAVLLGIISYFVLHGICEFCSVVQASCIILFIMTVMSYKKNCKGEFYASLKDFSIFTVLTLVSMIIPLLFWALSEGTLIKLLKGKHLKVAKVASIRSALNDSHNGSPMIFKPLFDNTGIDYHIGDPKAEVSLVMFTDFECGYCQVLHEKVTELKELTESGKLVIYMRNWPLSYHKHSKNLAVAARCAGEQGQFWAFADWAFASAKKFARNPEKKAELFSSNGQKKQAKLMGLDLDNFDQCRHRKDVLEKINKDAADATTLGGEGTPFVILNSQPYEGNWLEEGTLKTDIKKLFK